MGIYTSAPNDFVNIYSQYANRLDQKGAERTKQYIEGATNLVKGGADAYKFQQRKNDLDKLEEMKKKLEELKKQREALASVGNTNMNYFDSVMSGINPALMGRNVNGGV